MVEELTNATGLPRDLIEAVNTAKPVQLKNVIRMTKGLAREVMTLTMDTLREIVFEVCGDAVGRRMVEEILLGGQAVKRKNPTSSVGVLGKEKWSEKKRDLVEAELSPVFDQARKKAKGLPLHETTVAVKKSIVCPRLNDDVNGPSSTIPRAVFVSIPKHVPSSNGRKSIDKIFAADTQRRIEEELLRQKIRGEDERRKTCGRCRKMYIESRNEEDACIWHSGALRQVRKVFYGRKWNCCKEDEEAEGCIESQHVDGSIPSVGRELKRMREIAEEEAENAGYMESTDDEDNESLVDEDFDEDPLEYKGRDEFCSQCYSNVVYNYRRFWENDFVGWAPPICDDCASEEDEDEEEDERKEEMRQREIALLNSKFGNDDKCGGLDAELSLLKPLEASRIVCQWRMRYSPSPECEGK